MFTSEPFQIFNWRQNDNESASLPNFPHPFQNAENVRVSEEGTQSSATSEHSQPLRTSTGGFILHRGRKDLRLSALQHGTMSAWSKTRHQCLIKDLYPYSSYVFAHFEQSWSPIIRGDMLKVGEGVVCILLFPSTAKFPQQKSFSFFFKPQLWSEYMSGLQLSSPSLLKINPFKRIFIWIGEHSHHCWPQL